MTEESEDYDPFADRKLAHPTSDLDTLIHLLKGSLGSGILAMPMAFANAGLFFGLICTIIVGVICAYCVHILVKSAHALCRRNKIPSLGYAEVAEVCFLTGPERVRPLAKTAKFLINLFLCIDLLGCCCVYVVFVAESIKQVVDFYTAEDSHLNIRIYSIALLPPLILINLIRNLKFLVPLSLIANILIAAGVGITYYYLFIDLSSVDDRPFIVDNVAKLPRFFGTAIFALEGIGVVMPLENNMKTPTHFIGCPSVLTIGMSVVVFLYSVTGFLGYLKYGDEILGSVSLNLPQDEELSQAVKLMIAIAIFFTYALQFYVPMGIIWKCLEKHFVKHPDLAEYCVRIILVTLTVVIIVIVPDLEGSISLVGAFCLSMLGLIFPAVIELITFYEEPHFKWRIPKNIFLILFGLLGFFSGTYVSIEGMIHKAVNK